MRDNDTRDNIVTIVKPCIILFIVSSLKRPVLIGHLQFLVKTATLFFSEVLEATIDITIASKTNEVQR